MQQKNIIIFIAVLFIACSVWLFGASSDYLDPDKNKNWWSLYFSEPQSNNINFFIENHSDKTQFQWKVFIGQENINTRQATIEKGEIYKVNLVAPKNMAEKKITVEVDDGENKKVIYKNL